MRWRLRRKIYPTIGIGADQIPVPSKPGHNITMKTYKNLYPKLCSYSNLEKAFYKAKKNKPKKFYVKEFEKDLQKNLLELKKDLETLRYKPEPLTKFTIHNPKTRVIRKSISNFL